MYVSLRGKDAGGSDPLLSIASKERREFCPFTFLSIPVNHQMSGTHSRNDERAFNDNLLACQRNREIAALYIEPF